MASNAGVGTGMTDQRNEAAGLEPLTGKQPGLDNPNTASLTARDTGDHSDNMVQVNTDLQLAIWRCTMDQHT